MDNTVPQVRVAVFPGAGEQLHGTDLHKTFENGKVCFILSNMAQLNFEPILNDLAEGKITAEEASRRIEELKRVAKLASDAQEEYGSSTGYTDEASSDGPTQHGPRPGGLERVRVSSVGRRVRIEGDPSVATLSVEGQHVLRRTGTVMEVTANGEIGPRFSGFSIIRPPHTKEHFSDIALGKELHVRVNPKLIVDVEVTTGGLKTVKVPRFGRVRVTGTGSTLEDVVEVQDLLAQAGGVTVEGPISSGRSRLRVESGSMTVNLTTGANVAIRGDARLGRISWPGDNSGDVDEYVVGNGAARLEVSVLMGMAAIKVEE